ncbi:MAG: BatA domain-containing protein, partial [Candidatus Saccharimonas sp.]|nr:BatA domain-containing protein [Planctomycetaceae bacterium]
MTAWLANHFFNPAFVAGGAMLLASPIIIHLINRMRFRRVRFAAMEFLLASQQRNRRRLLLEQLLLLLLRLLIVAAIVLLISRLILDPSQMSIFRGARAHHVVLLDDSLSMRDRWGETSSFGEALKIVNRLVAGGAEQPNTQKFTLLRLSKPEQPVLSERDVNEDFVTELSAKFDPQAFPCTHRALDLVEGLRAA